ncbi:hypothetical protein MMC11_006123 [Xylographa trunciseda]|nr:hypothetical protein [Xylographa trunciseda]
MPSQHHKAAYNAKQKAATKSRAMAQHQSLQPTHSSPRPQPATNIEDRPQQPDPASTHGNRYPHPPRSSSPSSRSSSPPEDLLTSPASPTHYPSPFPTLPRTATSTTRPPLDRSTLPRLFPASPSSSPDSIALPSPLFPPRSRSPSSPLADTSSPAPGLASPEHIPDSPDGFASGSASSSLSHISAPRFAADNGGRGMRRVERIGDEWQGIEDEVGEDGEEDEGLVVGAGRGGGRVGYVRAERKDREEREEKESAEWIDKRDVEDEEEEEREVRRGTRPRDYFR